ncbi:MAG: exonuclease domain-containing protein [Lachnospiraceae bacterium]|nr:exonuclease domain-containing protein [Lachnospiraceae bacterium]
MNYVVFDLEWNQPQDGKSADERRLAFEIIEIGAVKLNDELQIIDQYDQLIRPQVYQEINWRIRKMLDLKRGELSSGRFFPRAASEFLRWCGPDPVWCTWGSQDLSELRRNMKFYRMPLISEDPVPYLNIQRLYGIHIGNTAQSKALATAVEELGLTEDVPFHRAYGDAYYTAKVMGCLPQELLTGHMSYDKEHPPKKDHPRNRRGFRRRVRENRPAGQGQTEGGQV